MTPTATKAIATKELAKIEERTRKAYGKVQAAKRSRLAYEVETESLRAQLGAYCQDHPEEMDKPHEKNGRPLPGTRAAELREEMRERFGGAWRAADAPYPKQDEFDAAVREMHAAQADALKFRLANLPSMIEEVTTTESPGDLLRALVGWAEDYTAGKDRAHALVAETEGMTGQHLTFDPRADVIRRVALELLEHDITPPRLTELGEYRIEELTRGK